MNDKTYLQMMIAFMQELEAASSAEPYDPDSYNKIIDALNSTTRVWNRSRRRRRSFFGYLIWFLLGVLTWIVWSICF